MTSRQNEWTRRSKEDRGLDTDEKKKEKEEETSGGILIILH